MCLYTSINGNTSIIRIYVTTEGVKLGMWTLANYLKGTIFTPTQ